MHTITYTTYVIIYISHVNLNKLPLRILNRIQNIVDNYLIYSFELFPLSLQQQRPAILIKNCFRLKKNNNAVASLYILRCTPWLYSYSGVLPIFHCENHIFFKTFFQIYNRYIMFKFTPRYIAIGVPIVFIILCLYIIIVCDTTTERK